MNGVLLFSIANPSRGAWMMIGTTKMTLASSGSRRRNASPESESTAAATVSGRFPPFASSSSHLDGGRGDEEPGQQQVGVEGIHRLQARV